MKSWGADLENQVSGSNPYGHGGREAGEQVGWVMALNCWRSQDERVPLL